MKYNPQVVTAYFRSQGLPGPVYEYQFAPPRKWRFDLAFPCYYIAIEVQGGIWTGGRHSRGSGFIRDMEKNNAAVLRGWKVLYVTPDQLCMMETILAVNTLLQQRKYGKGGRDERNT